MDSGDWLALEHFSEALANRNDRAWVIAGPVYFPGRFVEFIGDSDEGEIPVAVPHALFKILAIETRSKIEAIGFVIDQPLVDEIAAVRTQLRVAAPPFHYQLCPPQQQPSGIFSALGSASVGSRRDIGAYARPISQIERMTGLDFFTDTGGLEVDDRFSDLVLDELAAYLAFRGGDVEPNWIFDPEFFAQACGSG